MTHPAPMPLPRRLLAAYALPGVPIAAMGLPGIIYLPPYFAGELGLGLGAVGLVFLLVRVLDMPFDALFGALMDRWRSRMGRFRPWVLGGGVVLIVAISQIYFAQPGVTIYWAFGWLFLFYLAYSAIMLGHMAWGAVLSPDYAERARVFGWWQAAQMLGLVGILTLPALVGQLTGRTDAEAGIHAMGWALMIALPLGLIPLLLFVREPERMAPAHRIGIADFRRLARDPLVVRLMAVDLFVCLAPGVSGALFRFYFERVLGHTPVESSLLLLVYLLSGLLAAPLWVALARRTSKHVATAIAAVLYAGLHVLLFLLPPGGMMLTAGALAVAGLPYAAGTILLRAMLADVADVDRDRSGQDNTGLLYAVLTFTTKLGFAIPVGLTYPLLQFIDFDATPGAFNSAASIGGLQIMFILIPALFALAAAALVIRWPLGVAEHAAVRARLDVR
jgi:glycoside/pentoside/hexuronide:cation symporter, GPH family